MQSAELRVQSDERTAEDVCPYERGYEDGVRELARRLENYYKWLGGSKTLGYTVEFTIKEKVKDILGDEGV